MFVGYTFVRFHPWFVCTEPDRYGSVVIVNFTEAARAFDHTCVVKAGEHPLIVKDSAVYYDLAELMPIETLQAQVKNKIAKPREVASDELMARLRQGAKDSPHTPDDVRIAVIRCPWKPKT